MASQGVLEDICGVSSKTRYQKSSQNDKCGLLTRMPGCLQVLKQEQDTHQIVAATHTLEFNCTIDTTRTAGAEL
jgi:hypothetical protein